MAAWILQLALAGPSLAVEIDWVVVGAPGNEADGTFMSCCFDLKGTTGFGSVGSAYRIGRVKVTNSQYAEFLNAVAASDLPPPNELWQFRMGLEFGGIERSGSEGDYRYGVKPDWENRPVNWVDAFRAFRFANWLHNGQPHGAQDATTTEDGAYTLLGGNPFDVERNPGATVFVPSEDEWYKAAYYDPASGGYFDWPTASDDTPDNAPPPGSTNSCHYTTCLAPVGGRCCGTEDYESGICDLLDVGSHPDSASPSGTLGQCGNLIELTETTLPVLPDQDPQVVIRGTAWFFNELDSRSDFRNDQPMSCPGCGFSGFRVAAVAPGTTPEMEFVTVGDPGNPADGNFCSEESSMNEFGFCESDSECGTGTCVRRFMNCCEDPPEGARGLTDFGSVDYVYEIGKYEVTVWQWVELLNAVAASDPNGLYNENNGDRFMSIWVRRSGSDGSYSYQAVLGTESLPIGFLDFYDTLRFANWMHNGKPVGDQDATTTEDGAYTLTGEFEPAGVTRNPAARFALPSEDEWYKAAFYDPVSQSYASYPTGFDTPSLAGPPPGGPNSANFADPAAQPQFGIVGCGPNAPPEEMQLGVCDQTDVGAYVDASSFFGTFDQGGNHLEWNEAIYVATPCPPSQRCPTSPWDRGFRGGWWARGLGDLGYFNSDNIYPEIQNAGGLGFRVVRLPEPGSGAGRLLTLGALAALARRRTRGRA